METSPAQDFGTFAVEQIIAQCDEVSVLDPRQLRDYLALFRALVPNDGRVLCQFGAHEHGITVPKEGLRPHDLMLAIDSSATDIGGGAGPRAVRISGDASVAVPLPDQSCDIVFVYGSAPRADLFQAVLRVLMPGGKLCYDLKRPASEFGGLVPNDLVMLLKEMKLSLTGISSDRVSEITRFTMMRTPAEESSSASNS
ncbi:MAG: class I SAM-dependent methyltransferase [Oligoflexia bacterium]|nr:class I SAM-dependent methyltransferase [Oligoflexia bacterium]